MTHADEIGSHGAKSEAQDTHKDVFESLEEKEGDEKDAEFGAFSYRGYECFWKEGETKGDEEFPRSDNL